MFQHIRNLRDLDLASCQLTIGSFDGIHLGHQQLIKALVDQSRREQVPPVVLTFYPHPALVLRGPRPYYYLTTQQDKADLLQGLGIAVLISHPFDIPTSQIHAADFLAALRSQINFQDLWISENFALGHDRQGDRRFLSQAAVKMGFNLHIVPPLLVDGELISSTRIRNAVREGRVRRAAEMLGRRFSLPGTVVRGAERGRSLGFPTANLAIEDHQAHPAPGVYACMVTTPGGVYPAVTNIGLRPTFDEGIEKPVIEAHLLNFSGDLYAKPIRVTFIERLRDEMRFADKDALRAQIELDIRQAQTILKAETEVADG